MLGSANGGGGGGAGDAEGPALQDALWLSREGWGGTPQLPPAPCPRALCSILLRGCLAFAQKPSATNVSGSCLGEEHCQEQKGNVCLRRR